MGKKRMPPSQRIPAPGFKFIGSHTKKMKARKDAAHWRSLGFRARVVPIRGRWFVFRKPKGHRSKTPKAVRMFRVLKRTRHFGGQPFALGKFFKTKAEAQAEAKRLRKFDWKVRVVPTSAATAMVGSFFRVEDGWRIYRRPIP